MRERESVCVCGRDRERASEEEAARESYRETCQMKRRPKRKSEEAL